MYVCSTLWIWHSTSQLLFQGDFSVYLSDSWRASKSNAQMWIVVMLIWDWVPTTASEFDPVQNLLCYHFRINSVTLALVTIWVIHGSCCDCEGLNLFTLLCGFFFIFSHIHTCMHKTFCSSCSNGYVRTALANPSHIYLHPTFRALSRLILVSSSQIICMKLTGIWGCAEWDNGENSKSSSSSFHPKGVGGAGRVWRAFC
jgi:hypothetical protein